MVAFYEYSSRFVKTGKRGRPKLEPQRMVTLRMNKRLNKLFRNYCVQEDVSQRECIEMAIQDLITNRSFAKRVKERRRRIMEERNAAPFVHLL